MFDMMEQGNTLNGQTSVMMSIMLRLSGTSGMLTPNPSITYLKDTSAPNHFVVSFSGQLRNDAFSSSMFLPIPQSSKRPCEHTELKKRPNGCPNQTRSWYNLNAFTLVRIALLQI